jgi:predicted nucleic acid-binding protein
MKIADALKDVYSLFLDTAPIIYFVEGNLRFIDSATAIFETIDNSKIEAVTSPVTLAECLVHPYRLSDATLQKNFNELITTGRNTRFVPIGQEIGRTAAELRARYNLALTDALQIGTALSAGCDAFLTNDNGLKRVSEIRILVLEELEP